jgi:ppGpp synthetase/RelA/SpoT-type nucleotidyltranferase
MHPAEGFWTSRSKVERLGRDLLLKDPPDEEYIQQLHEMLDAYDNALSIVTLRIKTALSIDTTSRLKNTGTILEKLRRSSSGSFLSKVQDIAGARIVDKLDLLEQDELVRNIARLFEDGARLPKVVDRRKDPRQGYRAVHLIVYIGRIPVEIQVRTILQHWWANLFEKLADEIGREVRYGEPPKDRSGGIVALARKTVSEYPRPLTESNARLEGWVEGLHSTPQLAVKMALNASETIDQVEIFETFSKRPHYLRRWLSEEGMPFDDGDIDRILNEGTEAREIARRMFEDYNKAIDAVIETNKKNHTTCNNVLQRLIEENRSMLREVFRQVTSSLNLEIAPDAQEELVRTVATQITTTIIQRSLAQEQEEG